MTPYEFLNGEWKDNLKKDIEELRTKENAVRHAFANPTDDTLWVQMGGPLKAAQMRHEWQSKRIALEEVYYKVFGEVYEYRVFNEF